MFVKATDGISVTPLSKKRKKGEGDLGIKVARLVAQNTRDIRSWQAVNRKLEKERFVDAYQMQAENIDGKDIKPYYQNIALDLLAEGQDAQTSKKYQVALQRFKMGVLLLNELEIPLESDTLINMAQCHFYLGHFKKAFDLYAQGLAKDEDGPEKGTILGNMGMCLLKQQKYSEAQDYFYESLEALEESFGKESLQFGKMMNNLGCALFAQKKYTEAQKTFKDVLAIFEKNELDLTPKQIRDVLNNISTCSSQ